MTDNDLLDVFALQVGPVGERNEGVHRLGVELRAPAPEQLLESRIDRELRAVRPVTGHGIKRVRNCRNTRFERNRLAGKLVRQAETIPALVMAAYDVEGDRVIAQQRLEGAPTSHGVLHDVTVLFVGQRTVLVKHLFTNTDLP